MKNHPVVSFYKTHPEGRIVRHSVIVLSEDTVLDHHAVHHYVNLATDVLKAQSNFNRIVRFSDRCSGQYKSSGPFADLSLVNISINRNYFGSEHGKGVSDAETGVVKRALDRATVARTLQANGSKDAYLWCRDNFNSG